MTEQQITAPVFVDAMFTYPLPREGQARRVARRNGGRWCHMWSDDLDALHRMAKRIGMRREWFQNKPGFPHYDLVFSRRQTALSLGAVEMSLNEWIKTQKVMRQTGKRL